MALIIHGGGKVVDVQTEEEHKTQLAMYTDYIHSLLRVKKAAKKLTF